MQIEGRDSSDTGNGGSSDIIIINNNENNAILVHVFTNLTE